MRNKDHWYKGKGTLRDFNLTRLEIKSLLKYFSSLKGSALDVGCGNGYATAIYSQKTKLDWIGIDIDSEMLNLARENKVKVKYLKEDVSNLPFENSSLNVVLSERCLINILSWDMQKKALSQITRVLKKEGKLVLLEGSSDGLKNLNKLRIKAKLSPITVVYHNLFFKDSVLERYLYKKFKLIAKEDFCSTYMLITRVIHPKLSKPNYNSSVNKLALDLPNIGSFGYLKIWVWEKL